ncbi:MAG: putative ATP-dependent helicase [Pseudonocardiales bacterium]|nr:putative ATP-dependent helicase [Pseudonocardiales bacterium]
MVLAGPGTGKTTTLVEAVADRILNRGVPVEQILLLTFGQRAAGELRDRITTRLNLTVREPLARTFHSYAFAVLRMAADTDLPPPRLLSGTEQDIMLRELIQGDIDSGRSPWPSGLQAALTTHGFAAELRDLLLRAAERGVDPDDLSALGSRFGRSDWVAAATFMRQYAGVTAFARPGAYDAAELIQGAIGALDSDGELLSRERARRRHIFVDEFQDTDPAQLELLTLLAAGAEELVLVGDPDQSIYAFRGADPEAMRRAGEIFAPAGDLPTVALTTSRRSGATLLAATRRLANRLPAPVAHRALIPAAGVEPGQLNVTIMRSATEEAATIASRLRRAHLEDRVPWAQMAVIVRSTSQSLAVLRRAMITAGVPTVSAGADVPLAEQTAISQLLTALDVVVHPASVTDQVAETLLLGAIGDADAMYLRRLRRELHRQARAAGESPDAELIVPLLTDPVGIGVLPARLRGPLNRVASVLATGRASYELHASAEDVLWAMWEATGLATVWERRSAQGGPGGAAADRDLDAVIDLFAAAARLADRLPGATADALYDHVMAQQLPGDVWTRSAPTSAGVQILTAHASKGLEWDVVCVAAVQEGSWPDLRRRGSVLGSEFLVDVVANRAEVSNQSLQPLLEEERRLFYVAATRARKSLYITAVTGDDEQPSRFLDEIDPVEGDRPVHVPTRGLHLSDLVAELRTAVTDPSRSASVRAQAAESLARLAAARVPGADPDQWWGLADLSDERGLIDAETLARVSPSQIDSYVKCALRTMLDGAGAREENTAKAELGSAIHEIAEVAEAAAGIDELEAMMTERWPGLDFGAPWYGRLQRKKATQMLERLSTWLSTSRTELSLVGQELAFSVEIDGARLGGKVDRVERDADGRLIVVDFKTGGTPATSAELPQHPQLGAYQLAVLLGAFGEEESRRSGGARLVQLGISRKDPEQSQPPMLDLDDAEWIRGMVGDVARLQRGHRFDAKVNQYCMVCAVKRLCPAQNGRQVTQP